jgi:hypothetical protein
MNWYMIKTKDTYVSKFFIFLIFARSGPEWGYDWWKHINIDVTLPFWVIVRSGRWNVMNPTKGEPYLVVGVRGILLPWVILRREVRHDHIWISNFLWHQFRGWGYTLIGHMGGVYPYMGPSTPPRVFWGTKMCLTLLLESGRFGALKSDSTHHFFRNACTK